MSLGLVSASLQPPPLRMGRNPAGGKLSVGLGTPELGVVRYRGRDLQGDKVDLCESWAIGCNPP